jgi:hypothetical protein
LPNAVLGVTPGTARGTRALPNPSIREYLGCSSKHPGILLNDPGILSNPAGRLSNDLPEMAKYLPEITNDPPEMADDLGILQNDLPEMINDLGRMAKYLPDMVGDLPFLTKTWFFVKNQDYRQGATLRARRSVVNPRLGGQRTDRPTFQ